MRLERNATILVLAGVPVILCLIGAVAFVQLLISQLDTDGIEISEAQEALRSEEATSARMKSRIETVKAEIAGVTDAIDSRAREQKQIAEMEKEILDKRELLEQLTKTLSSLKAEEAALQKDAEELKILQEKSQQVAESIAALQAQLTPAKDETEVLRSRKEESAAKQGRISVTAVSGSNSGTGVSALFVDCTASGVVTQPGGSHYGATPESQEKSQFLEAARRTRYVMYLIRPDGLDTFGTYRDLVLSESGNSAGDIDLGWEPVNADWVLEYPEQEESRE